MEFDAEGARKYHIEHERLRAVVVEKSKAAQWSLASITFLNVDVGNIHPGIDRSQLCSYCF
jgi:hypothetical protein